MHPPEDNLLPATDRILDTGLLALHYSHNRPDQGRGERLFFRAAGVREGPVCGGHMASAEGEPITEV